jgi:hypothetical protein
MASPTFGLGSTKFYEETVQGTLEMVEGAIRVLCDEAGYFLHVAEDNLPDGASRLSESLRHLQVGGKVATGTVRLLALPGERTQISFHNAHSHGAPTSEKERAGFREFCELLLTRLFELDYLHIPEGRRPIGFRPPTDPE